jgi:hypothetical protein
MTITFNNPDAPATSKQLWLLHILTKQDTRTLKLTIREASERIESAKTKPKQTAPIDKRIKALDKRYHNLTGAGLDISGIKIIQAFKDINKHGIDSVCISVKASGIFPQGKKPHILSTMPSYKDDEIIIRPLYGYIHNEPRVKVSEYREWVKSLPLHYYQYSDPIPEDWKVKVEEIARNQDKELDIVKII